MPPRAMRAGAVWYRYTTGYRSVSLPSTVGGDAHIAPFVNVTNSPKIWNNRVLLPRADVGIGPYGYEPTNSNFRDSLWSRGPKDVTGLTESVTHWLRALPAKFQFIILFSIWIFIISCKRIKSNAFTSLHNTNLNFSGIFLCFFAILM